MFTPSLYGGYIGSGAWALTPLQTVSQRVDQEGRTIPQVKGQVFDDESLPAVGAVLKVEGRTDVMAVTDADGRFTMKNIDEGSIVVVTHMGMKTARVKVSATMTIRLVADDKELDEVVVTGMFNRKKEGFTGSAVTIKGEDLKKYSTNNVVKALAAVAPGLRIMDNIANGSNPNNLPDMRMRGGASIELGSTSSDVLSVQGEYQTYANQPLLIMDGFEINVQTLTDLDPDRILSISLLKDAAATAIYGSRAANGVIIIESKTPKPGRIWVTYGGELRVETPDLTGYDLMNASEKLDAELKSGLYTYGGETVGKWQLYQSKLREVLSGVDTYWLDKPLRTAFQQRHTVTLEGGDEALRYRMYIGYNGSPGVMKGSNRDVLTGSLDFQYRLPKVLLKNIITLDNSVGNESPWGSFSEYTKLNPYLRAYDEKGNIPKYLDDFSELQGASHYLNPMYNTTFHSKDQSKNFAVREQFKVEYTPTRDWRFEGAFSLAKSVGHHDVFRPAQHTAFDNITDPVLRGDYRRNQSESVNWGLDLTGSWNKQLNDHYLTGNLRMSLLENTMETYGNYVTGFPNDNMDNLLFGRKYNEKVTGLESTNRSIGWVMAGGYSYKYKYSFDFNVRVDGSSEFGRDNRWAPFWSTGLRWDVKKENWLKNANWLSDFVIRATYGTTGSRGFDPYQAHGYYTYSNLLLPYYSSDATGSEILAMHNENLKWQTTHSANLGVELGFLNGRITARMDYYRKTTNNTITQVTLAPSIGFGSYPENVGKVENRGMEFNLSFIPYRDNAHQAYWTVTLNGSHNTDKLVEISEAMRHINEYNAAHITNRPLPRFEEGQSLSRIWVVRSLGIDPATGDEILMRRNGEMTSYINWNAVDIVPIGNTEPKWQGHINSSFTYQGWGLDLSLSYRFGGQVYNQTLLDKVENADLRYNSDRRVMQLRWQKPGMQSQFMKLTPYGRGTKATSRFIMDENVLQGSSLTCYYRMDRRNSGWIKKAGLTSAKVALNVEDFFYLSTVKRERGLDYPFSRQFTFSLNLGF
ncbi:SusC/RagA family TonB-linked outer membrane protein [Prevotella sp. KH2C16]|uniref:SusC/RagA family TonB-linked outer membrane protein n=1 Tax=Prevotella sp. KH2C16 TaxID=1855325 RepID=UPI0008E82594|nr:SusC/RagA family TonB-linked outer membrane protein [Prevotella sp. KH2C16]SFG76828.1 TonB-linked outer membrane protein, SusC/RagA family [Prevotella sp. KH2C16]